MAKTKRLSGFIQMGPVFVSLEKGNGNPDSCFLE